MTYITNNIIYFKLMLILSSLNYTQGSIDGTCIPFKPKPTKTREECNPLYWYPKHIPEYCYYKDEVTQKPPEGFKDPPAIPVPIPAIPPQIPSSYGPVSPPYPGIFSQTMQLPYPLPFGIPIIPTNPMLPIPGIPMPIYSSPPYILAFASPNQGTPVTKDIHGLPGIMTPDGGMNILPFTDVITDLLQKHKKKILLKRLKQMSN